MDRQQVVVIGGGAAGFFAAINCAEANPNKQVIILEGGRRILTKVRISGGGRCNVTHHCFEPQKLVTHYPRGERELRGPFSRFQAQDTVAWFERRGVKLKTEADGRMFAVTDSSQTIIDCLVAAAQQAGVKVELGRKVVEVAKEPAGGFSVTTFGGGVISCGQLLLATGSAPLGYEIATKLGHQVVAPVPSLFTFKVAEPLLTALAGVAVDDAAVALSFAHTKTHYRQRGPVLITHWGLSGPAVLKLSAWGARELHTSAYEGKVVINWLPKFSEAQLTAALASIQTEQANKAMHTTPLLGLPRRLWQFLLVRAGITQASAWRSCNKKQGESLLATLAACEFAVAGKGEFKEEFVTCGGIALQEVDFKTMSSKLVHGLHFAGEILNIDGVTGGFNFQNAWTTAWLAAQSMAKPL